MVDAINQGYVTYRICNEVKSYIIAAQLYYSKIIIIYALIRYIKFASPKGICNVFKSQAKLLRT